MVFKSTSLIVKIQIEVMIMMVFESESNFNLGLNRLELRIWRFWVRIARMKTQEIAQVLGEGVRAGKAAQQAARGTVSQNLVFFVYRISIPGSVMRTSS